MDRLCFIVDVLVDDDFRSVVVYPFEHDNIFALQFGCVKDKRELKGSVSCRGRERHDTLLNAAHRTFGAFFECCRRQFGRDFLDSVLPHDPAFDSVCLARDEVLVDQHVDDRDVFVRHRYLVLCLGIDSCCRAFRYIDCL